MIDLKFNTTGTDSQLLSHASIFLTTLFALSLFGQQTWPGEKLGSQSVLQKCLDVLRQTYEGGLTGSHQQIAARRLAREDLVERIRRILCYLNVMADEDDIAVLLGTGVVTQKNMKKSTRKTAKPAVAN